MPGGPAFLAIVAATVAAGSIAFGARQGLEGAYQAELQRGVDGVNTSARTVALSLGALGDGKLAEPEARQQVARAAREGQEALTPLRATGHLRGAFVVQSDSTLANASTSLFHDFGGLIDAVQEPRTPLSVIAQRADRVIAGTALPEVSSRVSASEAAGQVRRAWLQGYLNDVRSLDTEFQAEVDDFTEWRDGRFKLWVEENRWDEVEQRVQRHQLSMAAAVQRLADLPVPPEAEAVASRYQQARARAQQSVDLFAEFVTGRGSVERPFRSSLDDMAQYATLRQAALVELEQIVRDARSSAPSTLP